MITITTCWADPLVEIERLELARKLVSAERLFGAGSMVVARQGRRADAAALNATSADMGSLFLDVIACAASVPEAAILDKVRNPPRRGMRRR